MNLLKSIWSSWQKFWFHWDDNELYSLALFRISFGLTMLFYFSTRTADIHSFYSDAGFLPSAFAKTLPNGSLHPSLLFSLPGLAPSLHFLFLISLVCFALGLGGRLTNFFVYFLHLTFLNRNQTCIFGVDMISTFFLFYCMGAKTSAYWSLDNLFFKFKRRTQSQLSHISYRLMQIQLCIVYAYAGLEKCKGVRWWDGSATWDTFSMGTLQRWDFSFVSHFPVLLSASTYLILFWEIYFPILVWIKPLRPYILWAGVLFHIQIGLFMNLPSFAAMMISYYCLFLEGDAIKTWLATKKLFFRQIH